MSTIDSKPSFGIFARATAIAIFAAAVLANGASGAASRSEVEHRQKMLRSAAEAADQRTVQQRDIAESQRQLLQYQIRKNQRMQMKMQCKAAGGGLAC